jgi:hypothetical protein
MRSYGSDSLLSVNRRETSTRKREPAATGEESAG